MAIEYPELADIGINGTVGDFMTFPNSIYPYFWVWIIGGIWLIMTFALYFNEKDKIGKGKFLSAMAVSSLASVFLSLFGTLLGIITVNIMVYIFVFAILMIVIWFFSKD